ncbi:putative zinc finger protein [Corchorus olitorius]|uniref:Zinc finger protein n=1 Tax=Corchorus olitorius TaxID=93759 RepID=A0A1R3JY30_9ROSI|nr:putative zinc finger protein [Corchorus olitorius]
MPILGFSSRPAWPYPWESISAMIPLPSALCHPGFPVTFYHRQPYLQDYSVPSPWHLPLATPINDYGKHSRDDQNMKNLNPSANSEKENLSKLGRSDLMSKTMKIDDPGETAKALSWRHLCYKARNPTIPAIRKAYLKASNLYMILFNIGTKKATKN